MEYSALPSSHDIRPDGGRLWAGGFATAIVAGLIALVGVLVCRWTFGIPILAPQNDGAWGSANTGWFVLSAALVALAATGVLHLLMLGTPDAGQFMKWIIGLGTLAAVVYPFSTGAQLEEKIATSIVCLVLGVAIGSLLSAVAARAIRRVPRNPMGQGYGPGPRGPYGDPPPRGYDDRGGYPDRDYGRGGPGYDPRYDDRRGYDRGGEPPPTRQYPPRDRWS